MSNEQKKFDDLMRKVVKVTPEELKRRMAAKKSKKLDAPKANRRGGQDGNS
jgi:hypothetical protein